MARLIDADNFMAELESLYKQRKWDKRDIHFSLADIECNLDMMPIIKVVLDFQAKTVRHGHWEYKHLWKGVEAKYCECSACHHPAWWATDYCPNCGAKMDEVKR